MKKIFILSILFCFGFAISGNTQNSAEILSEMSKKAKAYRTVKADFISIMEDKQSGRDPIQQSGSIMLKGKSYKVSLGNYEVISDATNIWTYDKESNFCSIDLLEDIDNDLMDPSKIFTIWENDFKSEYKGEESVKGVTCQVIHLYPNNPDDVTFHTIVMFINKEKKEVNKMVSMGRDGTNVTYYIKKFETNVDIRDNVFGFVKGNYPGVEVEDNRF